MRARPVRAALGVALLVSPVAALAPPTAASPVDAELSAREGRDHGRIGRRPAFQMPFPCNERWHAQTRPGHHAIDWNLHPHSGNTDAGRPIVASAAGHARVRNSSSYGHYVIIDHGGGWQTRYAHLQAGGRVSGPVRQGQRIGRMGNSGRSTKAHLHWEQLRGGVNQPALYADGRRVPLGYNWSRNCQDPQGHVDRLATPKPGRIRVRGWAYDPNLPLEPTRIFVAVGGAGRHDIGFATLPRPEVRRIPPEAGDDHGFDVTFTTGVVGSRRVCVIARNRAAGKDAVLGCRQLDLRNADPTGRLWQPTATGDGGITVRGWAYDPSAPLAAIPVSVYVGGRPGADGVEGPTTAVADVPRPEAVALPEDAGDDHGFDLTVPTTRTGVVEVCVVAADVAAPGADRVIGCRTVDLGPVATPAPSPAPRTDPP